ncbi:MAG: pyruvate formate lyase family protein, partial [Clostridia bacterium]|nr:pyruvate formate lyase family protein [Clostridia bacterium]
MKQFFTEDIRVSDRIALLKNNLLAATPQIESDRAVILTESYKQTEGLPIIERRAKAFAKICRELPIVIRDHELIVGSNTKQSRSCQVFPEYSFEWLEAEFDTVATRSADPFYISEETKRTLTEAYKYWKGKTSSDLALSYMAPEAQTAIEHNIFTPGNYFYNGIGHVTVDYALVLKVGYKGIIEKAKAELAALNFGDADYATKRSFIMASIESMQAAVDFAHRYSALARETALGCSDENRRNELLKIADVCNRVPENGAQSFYEACQSFWFIQLLLQTESSGHSISPGRFDQYMYPYYKADLDRGIITRESAQELIDCIWIKLNDLNKVRDAASAEGFAGYSLFQT